MVGMAEGKGVTGKVAAKIDKGKLKKIRAQVDQLKAKLATRKK